MNSVLVAFSLAQPVLNTTHDISKQHSTIDNISNKNTPTTPPNCPYEFHGLSLSKLTQFCESIIESPCSYEIKPITLNTFSVEGASAATRYVILLSGPPSQIIATQRSLLEKYPSEASVTLKVRCRRDLCEGDTWKPEVQVQIDDIIRDEGVDINFSPVNTEVFADFKSGSNDTYLSINGKPSSVEKVRQEIVRLEQSHCNMHCKELNIDAHMLGIISGPNCSGVKSIETETCTRVIIPRSYGNLLEDNAFSTPPRRVLVTGEQQQVEKAVQMIHHSISKANMNLIKRHVTLQSRKLDWLPVLKYNELMDAMNTNGTAIMFPSAEASHPYVIIYGQSEIAVSRTTKAIMQMTSDIFSGWLWLESNIPSSQAIQLPSKEETEQLLTRICMTSGAEVTFRDYCFEVCGEPHQLKDAFRLIGNEYSFQLFQRETKFQVELATEHREFISGKKNGKINKIMKMANVKVGFENLNECNFFINIYSPECGKTLEGLKLLQEELPAEVSFFVPENYHKRIIGVGGKNIQRIMKQFGVYVKFSTAEEFAAQGVSVESGDNVVARTPAKNAINLVNFKKSIIDLIENMDQDWLLNTTDYLSAGLVSEPPISRSTFTQNDTGYSYPSKSNYEAYEPLSRVSQRLQDLSLNEKHIRYPQSATLYLAVNSEEFGFLVHTVKHELNIVLIASPPNYNDFSSGRNSIMDQGHFTFILRYEARESSLIPRAQEMLQEFLATHHVRFPNTNGSIGTHNDPHRRSGRHVPVSASNGHIRDNRSYTLFDHRSGSSFFEPAIQRRQTDQGVTSNLQIRSSVRAISESFFDTKKNSKDTPWSNSPYSTNSIPSKAHYNGMQHSVHQQSKPYQSSFTNWSSNRGSAPGFNPFQTPPTTAMGRNRDDEETVPKSSFYSGYYGF